MNHACAVEVKEDSAREFVWTYGYGARAVDLATVLGVGQDDVVEWRKFGTGVPREPALSFTELFKLKHGRGPDEGEWPVPGKAGKGGYEWQEPELALLATLVGQISKGDISAVLTERLKQLTGDDEAERNEMAVQIKTNAIGLQSTDVVGSITITSAAKEVNSRAIVQHAVETGAVQAKKLGRIWVLSRESWESWKAGRVLPPNGFVQLSTLREQLGIKSDKLSEFARMGLVPTAVRCTPFGGGAGSTKFGTWYVSGEQAEKLLEDRRQGLKMPWQGKPLQDNLKATYKLWVGRKHPASCSVCADIWGQQGAPECFEDYAARYPLLAHGAKRHLTMHWQPGMTVAEIALKAAVSNGTVSRAIKGKLLNATEVGGLTRASRTDVARWIESGCPSSDSMKSWMSIENACKTYQFTREEVGKLILSKRLPSKICKAGQARGTVVVLKRTCALIRQEEGFSEETAAKKLGVTQDVLGSLLEGLQWRPGQKIPLEVIQAAKKRVEASRGIEFAKAASMLGVSTGWIDSQVAGGVAKVSQDATCPGRRVFTEVNFERLRMAVKSGEEQAEKLGADWMRMSQAATDAGVSVATLCAWGNNGEVERRMATNGWRYQRDSIRARARRYWVELNRTRKIMPQWLCEEMSVDC